MGNQIGKLCLCSPGAGAGDISGRFDNSIAFGDSICYVRPDPCQFSGDVVTFRSVSGATVSANSSATPSTSLDDSLQHSTVLDCSASFESSGSFTSMMMMMVPLQLHHAPRGVCEFQNKPNRRSLKKILSEAFYRTVSVGKRSILKNNGNANARVSWGTNLSGEMRGDEDDKYLDDGGGDGEGGGGGGGCDMLIGCQNLHWAQGRAGEDRMHIVICEDHGWVFVGILWESQTGLGLLHQ